jgi:DHA1 family tetracycline resistance protein-like MFS transporter
MTKPKPRKRLSPIFVIVLTVFIDITGYGIIIPLLPFYTDEFQAGPAALGILIASFAIMQFLFGPLLGRASDKRGRKPILLLSLLLSLVGFTIFSFANSYLMLLFSRIIAGIATERAVAQAYIADVTDHKSRTKELGKIGAALGAGFIIGPAIGGALSTYGYSIPGYAAMILTVINILSVIAFLPEPQKNKETIPETSIGYLRGIADSLKKPLLGPTLIILFIVTVAFSTIPVIVPLLSIDYFNFSSLELIALGPIVMAIGTILMPSFQNVVIFFIGNSLLAAGFGLINTSIPAFLSKRIALNEQGSVLGIASSASSIANIPGPLIIGFIYAFAGSFIPFLISAVILTAAFAIGCRVYKACRILN